MTLHPAHPLEQRHRELDRYWLARVRTMPLQLLLTERAAHCRLYHFGEECPAECWRGAAMRRAVTRRLLEQVPR